MCTMSAVTDFYRGKWTIDPSLFFPTYVPPMAPDLNSILFPKITVTAEQWAEYQWLKAMAAEIDAKTGQPDCVKPGVDEWEAAVQNSISSPVNEAIQHFVALGIESDTAHRMAIQTQYPEHRYASVASAVGSFAPWQDTSEGFQFWSDISDFYAVARGG